MITLRKPVLEKQKMTNSEIKTAIRSHLAKHSNQIDFDEENHTYTYKGRLLSSVSETLEYFKKGFEHIPKPHLENAVTKGVAIHGVLERYLWGMITGNDDDTLELCLTQNVLYQQKKDLWAPAIEKAVSYVQKLIVTGYEPLLVEQIVFSSENNLAGTIDMGFVKISEIEKEITILISDWKTGNLRASNYAQIGLYTFMLKSALKSLKMPFKLIVISDLISLKDGERMNEYV